MVVELRDDRWRHPAVWRLDQHDAASCLADRLSRVGEARRTASWGHLRLHEGRASPRPWHGPGALDAWARRPAGLFSPTDDVFAHLDHATSGCAPRDARVPARRATRAGLEPTRVPGPAESPVAA